MGPAQMERPLKRPADPEMTNPDSWIPAAKTAGWVDHVVKPEETKSKKEYVTIKQNHLTDQHKENRLKWRQVRRSHSRANRREFHGRTVQNLPTAVDGVRASLSGARGQTE